MQTEGGKMHAEGVKNFCLHPLSLERICEDLYGTKDQYAS